MSTANDALNDECQALNSIYSDDTIVVTSTAQSATTATLTLPNQPFSFRLDFPPDYPDAPPHIIGTSSTGNTVKGAGEAAVRCLVEVLGDIYTPGQVVLFDLVEESGPALEAVAAAYQHGEAENSEIAAKRSAPNTQTHSLGLTADPALDLPAPSWATTDALTIKSSVFVGRACAVSSMNDVENAVSHLLATNKKVASATHNIKAWRIQSAGPGSSLIQDYDDDGETAAGSRMLHLMQLMDAYGLVVVTRWYGGVQLGPDRFRAINNVARDALTLGGYVPEEKTKAKK